MFVQIIIVAIILHYEKTTEENVPGPEYVNVPADSISS
jgi:hypothetical protein